MPAPGEANIHPRLLEFADMVYELTGELKSRQELSCMDVDLITALFAHRKGVRFFSDYSKRPKNLQ